jgi:hypothetical protein
MGKVLSQSGVAIRMRRMRQRKKFGYRLIKLELSEANIECLVHRNLLKAERQKDLSAVGEAVIDFLLDHLFS